MAPNDHLFVYRDPTSIFLFSLSLSIHLHGAGRYLIPWTISFVCPWTILTGHYVTNNGSRAEGGTHVPPRLTTTKDRMGG